MKEYKPNQKLLRQYYIVVVYYLAASAFSFWFLYSVRKGPFVVALAAASIGLIFAIILIRAAFRNRIILTDSSIIKKLATSQKEISFTDITEIDITEKGIDIYTATSSKPENISCNYEGFDEIKEILTSKCKIRVKPIEEDEEEEED